MSRGTRGAEQHANMNPPLPPPPPNPPELMQMMVENQRLLTETINQMANQGGRNAPNGPAPNQYSSFKDFMDTKPPSFREAEEPLQAEEWLNTVEQKFRLLWLTDSSKKIASFKRGLGPKLLKTMGRTKCATFNEFVSDALTQENYNTVYTTTKTRK